MKTFTTRWLLLLCLLPALAFAHNTQTITVYFNKDQYILDPAEKTKLEALKDADVVKMQGYTDDDGGSGYNIALSQKRVREVQRLVNMMDSTIRIETAWFGEERPVNRNSGEGEKLLNRKVDITYISDPLLRAQVPVQSYKINGSAQQVIKCKQGTEIIIPAGTFAGENIVVEVQEYYNPLEILSANLNTTSNGMPLESAGMLFITATADGRKAEPLQPLTYKFAPVEGKNDFRFFEGIRDSLFQINWVATDTAKAQALKEVAKLPKPAETLEPITRQWNSFRWLESKVEGGLYNQFPKYHYRIVDSLQKGKGFMDKSCLKNTTVTVQVLADGTIADITTSYKNANNEIAERVATRFIKACLPAKFKPIPVADKITLTFGEMPAINQPAFANSNCLKQQGGTTVWVTPVTTFGSDHTADAQTDKIILSAQKLGWVNCDRYNQSTLVNYTVNADTGANVRIIMKNSKAYFVNECFGPQLTELREAAAKGQYIFNRVPDKEDVIIISTRKTAGKLYLAIADGTTGTKSFTGLQYKEVTQKELESIISNLKI